MAELVGMVPGDWRVVDEGYTAGDLTPIRNWLHSRGFDVACRRIDDRHYQCWARWPHAQPTLPEPMTQQVS